MANETGKLGTSPGLLDGRWRRWVPVLLLSIALPDSGCVLRMRRRGPTVTAQPDTKYYFLHNEFEFDFSPTSLGNTPEINCQYSWNIPLEEREIKPEGLRVWYGDYVTVKRLDDLPCEVDLWYRGIICRRFKFRYDDSSRLISRIDTEYESRRSGEPEDEWVARMKDKPPRVSCTSEVEYIWSSDKRTVTVKMLTTRENELAETVTRGPDTRYGEPEEVLETWEIDESGRIVAVFNHYYQCPKCGHQSKDKTYSASYDEAGRLVTCTRYGDETRFVYDNQGRIKKITTGTDARPETMCIHNYPDGPATRIPKGVGPPECSTYVVRHDKSGHAIEVKVRETTDWMGIRTLRLERDEQGRVRSYTLIPTRFLLGLIRARYVFD